MPTEHARKVTSYEGVVVRSEFDGSVFKVWILKTVYSPKIEFSAEIKASAISKAVYAYKKCFGKHFFN